jgi:hypothetical protein
VPTEHEIELHSERESVAQCVQRVLEYLYHRVCFIYIIIVSYCKFYFIQNLLPERAAHKLCGSPVRELYVLDTTTQATLMEAATTILPRLHIDRPSFEWVQVCFLSILNCTSCINTFLSGIGRRMGNTAKWIYA